MNCIGIQQYRCKICSRRVFKTACLRQTKKKPYQQRERVMSDAKTLAVGTPMGFNFSYLWVNLSLHVKNYCRLSIYRGRMSHGIEHIMKGRKEKLRSIYELTKNTPCLIFNGEQRDLFWVLWRPGTRLTKAYDVTIQRYRNSHAKIENSKMYILRCMGSKFCVKFQRCPLKFHTKFWTHTPQNIHFTMC